MSIEELHELAMNQADRAFLYDFRGEREKAVAYFRKALAYEKDAAQAAAAARLGQPDEGVLLRSAATMAYFCHEYQTARELAEMSGAAGAPFEIRYEIAELLIDLKEAFIAIADSRQAIWRNGEGLREAIAICGIPVPNYRFEQISLAEKFLDWAPIKAAELAEQLYGSILFNPENALAAEGPAQIFNRLDAILKLNP